MLQYRKYSASFNVFTECEQLSLQWRHQIFTSLLDEHNSIHIILIVLYLDDTKVIERERERASWRLPRCRLGQRTVFDIIRSVCVAKNQLYYIIATQDKHTTKQNQFQCHECPHIWLVHSICDCSLVPCACRNNWIASKIPPRIISRQKGIIAYKTSPHSDATDGPLSLIRDLCNTMSRFILYYNIPYIRVDNLSASRFLFAHLN